LNKARKGELAQTLPVGFIRLPDHRVQFDRLGSANAVLLYFRDQDLLMPRLILHGEDMGQIVWKRASYAAIDLVLTNPAYAGAFAFGRRKQAARRVPGEITGRVHQSIEEWEVLIPNVYPANFTWDHYLANRARLRQNVGCFAESSSVPCQGEAMLQGIVFCACCGRRMAVQYNGGAMYFCDHLKKRYGEPVCQHFTTTHVDQAVVDAFLEVIEPAHIEATLATLEQLDQQRQASDWLWQQRIERTKYEAECAHRQ
jgi:hypothetical protein